MHKDRWNRRYAERPLVWSREANATVMSELAALAPGRALELGCGEGRNAIWLASRGWEVTAVDFADAAIEKARRLAEHAGVIVRWLVADAADPTSGDGYDLVLVTFLHTSPAERSAWMARGRSALRPGGTFLYLGHDRSNIEHGHGGPRDSAVLCAPEDVVAELPGFRVERAEVIERTVASEPGHGPPAGEVARDTLVRAVKDDGPRPAERAPSP